MVLPVPNPTGNPYDRPNLAKIHDENELKGLQVKAELNKLGAPPRSFSQFLLMEPGSKVGGGDDEGMEDCEVLGIKSMTLSQRFAKIERARPAVHPITIQLANKLKTAQTKLTAATEANSSSNTKNSAAQKNNNPEVTP